MVFLNPSIWSLDTLKYLMFINRCCLHSWFAKLGACSFSSSIEVGLEGVTDEVSSFPICSRCQFYPLLRETIIWKRRWLSRNANFRMKVALAGRVQEWWEERGATVWPLEIWRPGKGNEEKTGLLKEECAGREGREGWKGRDKKQTSLVSGGVRGPDWESQGLVPGGALC